MLFKLFDSMDDLERIMQNNKPRLVIAGNKNVCIVRQGKHLIAFENECPHMGEGLSGGVVNYLNEIVCPLHTYKFSLKSGDEEANKCKGLKFINLKVINGKIYLEF